MKNSAKPPLLPEMIQREARNLQEGPHPTTLAPGLWHPAPETATSSHRGHERGKSCVQSWPSERCSEMPSFRRTEDKSIQQGTLTERTLEQPQAAHDEVQGARNGSLLPTASKEPRPSASSQAPCLLLLSTLVWRMFLPDHIPVHVTPCLKPSGESLGINSRILISTFKAGDGLPPALDSPTSQPRCPPTRWQFPEVTKSCLTSELRCGSCFLTWDSQLHPLESCSWCPEYPAYLPPPPGRLPCPVYSPV